MRRALVVGLLGATNAHARGTGPSLDDPVVLLFPAVVLAWFLLPAIAGLIVIRAGGHALIGIAGVATSAPLIAFTVVTQRVDYWGVPPLFCVALLLASPPGSRPIRKFLAMTLVLVFLIWLGLGVLASGA